MLYCVIPQVKRTPPIPIPARVSVPGRLFHGYRKILSQVAAAKSGRDYHGRKKSVARVVNRAKPLPATPRTILPKVSSGKSFPQSLPKQEINAAVKPSFRASVPGELENQPGQRGLVKIFKRSRSLIWMIRSVNPDLSERHVRMRLNYSSRQPGVGTLALPKTSPSTLAYDAIRQTSRILLKYTNSHCSTHFSPSSDDVAQFQTLFQHCNLKWDLKLEKAFFRHQGTEPITRPRSLEETRKIMTNWAYLDDLSQIPKTSPIYTLKDLTNHILKLTDLDDEQNPYFWLKSSPFLLQWSELREAFAELSPIFENYSPDYFEEHYKTLQQIRDDRLNRELKRRNIFTVIKLCRRGYCSPANREATWTLILRDKHTEKAHYKGRLEDYVKKDFFLDGTMLQSTAETIGNSDQFFNFLPQIQQVMQLFQRDSSLTELISDDHIRPFHEMPLYAGPLAFVSIRTKPCYFLFRQLYLRHFQHLHRHSANCQNIISLYGLFENLLFSKDPIVWEHLRVKVGIHPGEYVVPWLTMAFCGFIEIDQLLVLWDRLIGYGDNRLLVLLAVGVFLIRGKVLLKCKTSREIGAALSDILTIEVVPLLQLVLFT